MNDPKVCPRCGRLLEVRHVAGADGKGIVRHTLSVRCPTCRRPPNDCNCPPVVITSERGGLERFRELTPDGDVIAEEI